ncbi:peptide chain release factor 1 (bRF-1) [human gut metagenome]|uniref:Peptide chain release factor 1 (BRF-1) n=1 Tax=human gut metagenome TaxID=408170 RepID=K1S5N6_9ZZZZ
MADNSILTRLDGLKLKYEEIGQKLTDPEVIADVKQFIQFNKEYRELEPIIEASERYRTAIANLAEAKDILANDKDEEMREMARGEIAELEPKIETLEEEIKLLLIPKDPQDAKNAIVEIRGGTGGDEAATLRRRPAAHVHQVHRVEGLALRDHLVVGRRPADTRRS